MTLHDLPHPGIVCPDVAMLHCSPPDAHGFCTLGTSVDWARGAAEHAQVVGDGNGDGKLNDKKADFFHIGKTCYRYTVKIWIKTMCGNLKEIERIRWRVWRFYLYILT